MNKIASELLKIAKELTASPSVDRYLTNGGEMGWSVSISKNMSFSLLETYAETLVKFAQKDMRDFDRNSNMIKPRGIISIIDSKSVWKMGDKLRIELISREALDFVSDNRYYLKKEGFK